MAKRKSRRSRAARITASDDAVVAIQYIESSALVAAILEQDAEALKSLRAKARQITSALTFAEAARAIVRAQAAGRINPDTMRSAVRALRRFERRCYVVAVGDDVLARVRRPFPAEPVRTLDAVHLATAELVDDSPQLVTIVTRDARVRENALAMGYAVA